VAPDATAVAVEAVPNVPAPAAVGASAVAEAAELKRRAGDKQAPPA
jgi:hypothetical protein